MQCFVLHFNSGSNIQKKTRVVVCGDDSSEEAVKHFLERHEMPVPNKVKEIPATTEVYGILYDSWE